MELYHWLLFMVCSHPIVPMQQQWHTKDLAKGGGIPKTKGVEREEGTPQNSQFVCYAYDVPYNRAE